MARLRFRKPRESEPSSIYEHLVRLISDGCAVLDEQPLPDDDLAFSEGGLKWAAGALDASSWRHFARPDSVERDVEAIHVALVALSARPGMKTRAAVRRRFRQAVDREVVDGVIERFWSYQPADIDLLYGEIRSLLLESGRRDEVKWAIALVGTFGRAEDAELFRVFGRHSEFALYAAVALSHVVDDPVPEWRDLLRHSEGWGKTELTELLLRDPSPDTCGLLLREGLSYENALALAMGCRLDEVLAADVVDDPLFDGARSILDSLTGLYANPDELSDWPEAGVAVERFLHHFEPRARELDDYLTAHALVAYLDPVPEDNSWYEERGVDAPSPLDIDEYRERLAAAGLGGGRAVGVVRRCRDILQRPEWPARAEDALASADERTRATGIQVAMLLGLPIRPYLFDAIKKNPDDSGLWFQLFYQAPEQEFMAALELAERLLDLDRLASGPALDLFGPPGSGLHHSVNFILQELQRFPGTGGRLLEASLRSPVLSNRFAALRALARWPQPFPETVRAALLESLKDPDEGVRRDACAVLDGMPFVAE
jgi:hypothetical protein